MDNWNNEQKPDMSVSGQFSGNPYQDQNMYGQTQDAYDQGMHTQQNGADSSVQPQNNYANGYGQPQPQNNYGNSYGQPQPQNNYANGYGQPYANYNQPSYNGPGYAPMEKEEPIGIGEWTGLLAIVTFVPCIGLILLLVWAFGGSEKKSKSNFCKAYLIIALIRFALVILVCIIWGAALASAIENF